MVISSLTIAQLGIIRHYSYYVRSMNNLWYNLASLVPKLSCSLSLELQGEGERESLGTRLGIIMNPQTGFENNSL